MCVQGRAKRIVVARVRPKTAHARRPRVITLANAARATSARARVTRILVDDGHACDRRPRAYARESPTSTRRRPSRAHIRYARRNRAYRSVGTRANAFDDTSAYAEKSRLRPGACVHDYPATTPTKPSAAGSARTGAVRRTVDADTRVPRRPCDLIYRGASTRDSFCTAGNRPSDRRGPGLFGHEGRNLRSTCRCSHNLRITRRRAVSCGLHRPTSQVIHRSGLSTFYFSIKNIYRYEEEKDDVRRSPPVRRRRVRARARARDTRVYRRVRRKVIAE